MISPTAPLCAPQSHTEVRAPRTRPLARSRGGVSRTEARAPRRRRPAAPRPWSARRSTRRRQRALRDRRRRRTQRGPQRARRSRWSGPGVVPGRLASAPRSPHRSGTSSANLATASTPSSIPRCRASSCLRAEGDEWLFGVDAATCWPGSDEAEMTRLIRIAAGVPISSRGSRGSPRSSSRRRSRTVSRTAGGFLIGDAAHRVSPRGGTGMNSAIADGHDLGWKLGWVLSGWAGEDLLDTYETERRPVVGPQPRALRRRARLLPRRPRRDPRRPRGADPRTCGWRPEGRLGLDARPRQRRVDAVHRPGRHRRDPGDGRRRRAGHRSGVARHDRASTRDQARWARSWCGRAACPRRTAAEVAVAAA